MISIIVAFPKQQDAMNIRHILLRGGYDAVSVCTSGAMVLQAIDQNIGSDGIVITSFRLKDMMYNELSEYLPKTYQMVILSGQTHLCEIDNKDIIKMMMPIKPVELLNKINALTQMMIKRRKKRRQKPKLRSEMDQKTLGRAKELLIRTKGMDEDEAHRYIQKTSMDNGTNMVETAQMLLDIYREED